MAASPMWKVYNADNEYRAACKALLAAEPCDAPGALPLAFRAPAETSRALPNNRGFLRALPGGKGAPPAPRPEAPPPVAAAPVIAAPADEDPQLDLLSWRPRAKPLPPPGTQLVMFPDLDPEGGK